MHITNCFFGFSVQTRRVSVYKMNQMIVKIIVSCTEGTPVRATGVPSVKKRGKTLGMNRRKIRRPMHLSTLGATT